MIAKTARQLPPQMPAPPSYQKVNPGDQPVLFLVLRSATLPLSVDQRVRRVDHRAADLDGQRRRAGQRLRRREVRRARRRRPAQARGARHRHRRSRRRDLERQRQSADRHDVRHRQDLRRAGQRSAAAGRRVRADDHRLPRTATRSGSTKSRTSTTASRTTRTPRGTSGERTIYLAIQKQPGTNVVAVVRRGQAAAADLPRAAAGRRCRSTSAPTARCRSASRCTT